MMNCSVQLLAEGAKQQGLVQNHMLQLDKVHFHVHLISNCAVII